jgi:hypothetical protein
VTNPIEFGAYRPNDKGTGCAVQIKLPNHKECLFLEASAKQIDAATKKFDWENKIIMKLDSPDIGKMLSVLSKREKNVNLYHKSEKGVTTLSLSEQNTPYKGYYLVVTKKPLEGQETKAHVNLGYEDAEILMALLRTAIPILYKWV